MQIAGSRFVDDQVHRRITITRLVMFHQSEPQTPSSATESNRAQTLKHISTFAQASQMAGVAACIPRSISDQYCNPSKFVARVKTLECWCLIVELPFPTVRLFGIGRIGRKLNPWATPWVRGPGMVSYDQQLILCWTHCSQHHLFQEHPRRRKRIFDVEVMGRRITQSMHGGRVLRKTLTW